MLQALKECECITEHRQQSLSGVLDRSWYTLGSCNWPLFTPSSVWGCTPGYYLWLEPVQRVEPGHHTTSCCHLVSVCWVEEICYYYKTYSVKFSVIWKSVWLFVSLIKVFSTPTEIHPLHHLFFSHKTQDFWKQTYSLISFSMFTKKNVLISAERLSFVDCFRGPSTKFRFRQNQWTNTDTWGVARLYIGQQCPNMCHGHGECNEGTCM